MARTMSCGELSGTKFFADSGKVSLNGKEGKSFAKAKSKDVEANKKSDKPKEVYQLRGGARILKLENKAQYKKFREEMHKKLGKDASGLDINKQSLESVLKQFDGVYDGVIIGKDLEGRYNDPMLKESGVKIFNDEVLVKVPANGEKVEITPYRDNFKASGTDVSKDMKNLCSEIYNNLDHVKSATAEQDKVKHSVDDKGNITTTEADGTVKDVTKEIADAKSEVEKQTGEKVEIAEQKDQESKQGDAQGNKQENKQDSTAVSAKDALHVANVCKDMGNEEVRLADVILAMMLYQQTMNNNSVNNYSSVNSIAKLISCIFGGNKEAEANSGVNTNNVTTPSTNNVATQNVNDAVVSATTPDAGKSEITKSNASNIASGQVNSVYDRLVDAKKEVLHLEKMRWDKAISNAPADKKDEVKEAAKAHIAPLMNEYVLLKESGKGSLNVGDLKITADKNASTDTGSNSTTSTSTGSNSTLSAIRDELGESRRVARQGIKDAYNGIKTGVSNSGGIIKDAFGGVLVRVGNIIKESGENMRQ